MTNGKPLTRLERQMERLLASMERMNFEEYLKYVDDRKRQFFVNFMAGVARGLGAAVGFSVLGAMLVVILQRLASTNATGIGGFLVEVVRTALDGM